MGAILVAESLHTALERDRAAAVPDPAAVKEFRAYAEGIQAATLTIDQRRAAGALCPHPLVDNVCDLVLATAAARLVFTGYRVDDPAVQDGLDSFVVKNHLTDSQADVHYRTLRDGNHYLGLSWVPERQQPTAVASPEDAPVILPDGGVVLPVNAIPPQTVALGRVQVHHEPAWDGETGTFVGYDAFGQPAWAVKDFVQLLGDPPKPRQRRIVYFPDHLMRFIKDGDGWQPFTLPGETAASNGVIPWTKRDGRPLGIPIVHFASARYGWSPYGVSSLDGVLGLQDALNAALFDYALAAKLTAFPMLKVRGIDPGSAAVQVGPGRVVGSSSADSDVAMMAPGDLAQLKEVHASILAIIARNTATPLHLIAAAAWPSGEAIRQANASGIRKAYELGATVGPAWATLAHRATEMVNAFGAGALDEDALITTRFADPGQLDAYTAALVDKAKAETLATLSQVTDPVLLAKSGVVTEEEAAQIAGNDAARLAALPAVGAF